MVSAEDKLADRSEVELSAAEAPIEAAPSSTANAKLDNFIFVNLSRILWSQSTGPS
jgi:hypothetical protein